MAVVGHNGAGKSTLIKILSGACQRDSGTIIIRGEEATIANPRDAKNYGIETIYQSLALADNVDAAANLFLGRELRTSWGTFDDIAMEAEARKVMGRLNPHFQRFKDPVRALSGRPASIGGDRARDPVQRANSGHGRTDRGARTAGNRAGRRTRHASSRPTASASS